MKNIRSRFASAFEKHLESVCPQPRSLPLRAKAAAHIQKSQRDFITQPGVARHELRRVNACHSLSTPTGLNHVRETGCDPVGVEVSFATFSQGSLADSATAGLKDGIPLGFTETPTTFVRASALNYFIRSLCALLLLNASLHAQTLLNVDFGVGTHSAKIGFAATGQATNDFWNLYRHYEPRFLPGTKLVSNGELKNLKLSDGSDTHISLAVTNAPGVWGNTSGDPMFDTYIFAQNGSNLTVALHGLEAGRYHLYL